jgi:hypothetical protein
MKKSPKLKFSTFNGVNLEGFNPGIEYDKDNISDEVLKNLADELSQLGEVSKFIRHRIDDFQNSISHIRITSSYEEQKYFIDFYIFDLLTKIKKFIVDDRLLIDLTNNINEYKEYTQDQDNNDNSSKVQNFLSEGLSLGMSGKNLETYAKNKLIIHEKEQRQKVEEEAKLLGTEMQQLLPEIFEDKRAIPNSFLRGSLFGMVRKGRRKLVGEEPIFTMSNYDLSFTGFELDQNDLEVWDTLMYLAKERCIDSELRITLYDLCQKLRLKDNNINREAVIKRIERLKIGTVKIKTANKTYFGSLIDDGYIDTSEGGKLVIRYNKKLAPLFVEDYTFVSADIRHLLGDSQLARWLYSFYESHKKPIPLAINFIQKLCRSESQSKEFKRLIIKSLNEVKKAKISVDPKSKWDYHITADNSLMIFPNGKKYKQPNQIELF